MNTRLLLLTDGFPFGKSETFLETEIEFLAQEFQEIIIVSITQNTKEKRIVPDNVKVVPYWPSDGIVTKLKSLFQLFDSRIWEEFSHLKGKYSLSISKGRFATVLMSFKKAIMIRKRISSLVNSKTTLYSYWCNDSAIAIAQIKEKHPQVKAVTRVHGWDLYFEVSKVKMLPFRNYIAQHLDFIFPISEKGKNYIKDEWKVDNSSKIKVSRLGVKNTAEQIKKVTNEFVLVSCSNLIPLKRVSLIVQALEQISFPLRWIHFGDGPLFKEIKTKKLPLNINAAFMGQKSNKAVLDFYAKNKVELFINVSTTEGIPVSIMEVMSCGIPCIATDVGGNGEIVNSKNGKLISPNPSPKEIADTIINFVNMQHDEWKDYSDQAYETWKTRFNAEKNYKAFIKKIKSL